MQETAQLLGNQPKPKRPAFLKYLVVGAIGFIGALVVFIAVRSHASMAASTATQPANSYRKNVCLTSRFLTLDELKACVHSIPYNATEKAAILTHLRLAVPSYAFHDVAKTAQPFGPYTIAPVDLDAELATIEATDYANDLALHDALYNVFKKLYDAHTHYTKPALYAQFYALQPASLYSIERNGTQVVQLSHPDATEAAIYKTFYPDLDHDFDVSGWDVVEIDGAPALDTLRDFADTHVGLLKDAGTRFNLAVSGFGRGRGMFVYRPLSSHDVPSNASVEYSLIHAATNATKTVRYNWFALNGVAQPGRAPEESKTGKLEHYFQRLVRHMIYHSLFEPTPEVDYVDQDDADVGVLKIGGFSSLTGDEDGTFNTLFAKNVTDSLAQFVQDNKTTLVIDLTGNGGGDICLGYATIRYLFPQLDTTGPYEGAGPHDRATYHVKHSALFDLLARQGGQLLKDNPSACSAEFCPNAWYSAETKRQFVSDAWLTQGTTSSLGNVSQGLYFGCSAYNQLFPPPGVSFPGLSPDNVILVSHGYCGSTCSVFSSFIQLHGLAQTVAFGGYKDVPQQFFSFPGGQVYTTDAVYDDAVTLGVENSTLVPQPLSTISPMYEGATFGFAMVAISPWNSQDDKKEAAAATPLEYKFVPAAHYPLFPDNSLNATSLYLTAVDIVRGTAAQ
ncbi:Aste57867_18029 [Aphanomyces stellatus]|uniref:Aste57867_18029 protein n=1 Tax=Aphanomyces stellatus TaxID=120398 RepID=A0A485L8Z0_9STRA|nr:hypothetical protein As57867_017967 [Aphanomyces stellatus]VFT94768.1 Aste57867_18029 [Aphanomyces stellatus]